MSKISFLIAKRFTLTLQAILLSIYSIPHHAQLSSIHHNSKSLEKKKKKIDNLSTHSDLCPNPFYNANP